MSRVRALALVAIALALALVPVPAGGQVDAASGAVDLVAIPAWAPVGSEVPIRLAVDGDPARLEVRTRVHSAVLSRIGFERTVQGESLGGTLATSTEPLEALPPDATGRILTLSLGDAGVRRMGVYPVEIELRDRQTGDPLDGFVTHVVAVEPTGVGARGPAIGERLRTAWIWPVVADPALTADDRPVPRVVDEMASTGRLGVLATAAGASDGVPITLLAGPETTETWDTLVQKKELPASAEALRSLRRAAATNQVLAAPYVPVDVPSLEAFGLGNEVGAELAAGTDTLEATLGVRVDPCLAYVAPLDNPSLERLRQLCVTRVVVDSSALVPVDSQFTPAAPFALESGGRTFSAVATDPGLAALLEGDAPPALAAQRFLAGLSVVALEQPNLVRGVVVAPPAPWSPSAELLDAAVRGLRDNPLLAPASVDELLGSVPPEVDENDDQPVVRQLTGVVPSAPPVTPEAFRSAEAELNALQAMVGPDDPGVLRGRRALLVSLSSAWTGPGGRARAQAELDTIDAATDGFLSGVSVRENRTVTLTARNVDLPVSLLNETGRPVTVRVRLESDKLAFPDGSERVVELQPDNNTVQIPVETRATGSFPVALSVTSPDGRLVFQETRLTVRSTVVSGVGLILTVGAGAFLAVWWLNHFRRARRARSAIPAAGTRASA